MKGSDIGGGLPGGTFLDCFGNCAGGFTILAPGGGGGACRCVVFCYKLINKRDLIS